MRKLILTASAAAWLLVGSVALGDTYSYGGVDIPLRIDSSKLLIKLYETVDVDISTVVDSVPRVLGVLNDDHAIDGFAACTLETSPGYVSFMDSL